MPSLRNIEIPWGNTKVFTVTVRKNGAAEDITGGQFRFTAKRAYGDGDGSAVFTRTTGGGGIALTDPINGKLTVTVVRSNTTGLTMREKPIPLLYDLQYLDTAGKNETVLLGFLSVLPVASQTSP